MMKRRSETNLTVGAVIVNWNTSECLERALQSFVGDGVPLRNIIVVDQGSSDNSVARVKRTFADACIVSLPENRSYAAAINAGAARLKTQFFVVANADVEFRKGMLSTLLKEMERDEQNAVVGPRLLDGSGNDTTRFSHTGFWRALLLPLTPAFLRGWWRRTEQKLNDAGTAFPVSWVEGSFMLVRRSAFDELDGFDEKFSFYFEDGDFALRLRKLGYLLVHCPFAVVTHAGGASFSQANDRAEYEFYKNCLYFYRKHMYRKYVWLRSVLGFFSLFSSTLDVHNPGQSRKPLTQTLRRVLGSEERPVNEGFASVPARNPLISVIVPTYERTDCLLRLLDGLDHQTYRKFEIIVVDQSAERDPRKERGFRAFGRRLKVVRPERANRSYAKNLGTRYATGEILVFCDDDIEVEPDFLSTHVSAYADKSVGAVSCRLTEQHLPSLKTNRILRITWYGQMVAGYQSNTSCYVKSLVGGNMSVLRSVKEYVGEFDPSFGGTSVFEEPDFSSRILRAERRIFFTDKTSVNHLPHPGGSTHGKEKSASWYYHWFHHNEILYFLKNHSRINLFAVVPFCVLRTVKQSIKFDLSLRESLFVLNGIIEGFKTYYGLHV